jgi:hypothetical protein
MHGHQARASANPLMDRATYVQTTASDELTASTSAARRTTSAITGSSCFFSLSKKLASLKSALSLKCSFNVLRFAVVQTLASSKNSEPSFSRQLTRKVLAAS